jgi:serine/alanine adding enzyme
MVVDFLRATDGEWMGALAGGDYDVYCLPQYCVAASSSGRDGTPIAVRARSKAGSMLMVLLRRDLPGAVWDAQSPYGYPGIVYPAHWGEETACSHLQAVHNALRDSGCVSVVERLHPVYNGPFHAALVSGADFVHRAPTVAVDLRGGVEGARRSMRATTRSELRKLARIGCVVRLDAGLQRIQEFRALYEADMRRLGASESYFFGDGYYDALRTLPHGCCELRIAEVGGSVAAAALFFRVGGLVQYHLSATAPEFRRLSPVKAVLDSAIADHSASGGRWLHLGGGVKPGDALFQFKRGFSDVKWEYALAGRILMRSVYDDLSRQIGAGSGAYFPAYRQLPVKQEGA